MIGKILRRALREETEQPVQSDDIAR
jgi:hypothetical protein